MNIIKLIKEEYDLLLESVYNVDDDVDFIYNNFFKKDIDEFNKGNLDTPFKSRMLNSSIFESSLMREAHKINPVIIDINNRYKYNGYNYIHKILYFGINFDALEFIKQHGGLENAMRLTNNPESLKSEFNEYKIKGSIRHELIHYLDDTFTDLFDKRKIFKGKPFPKDKDIYADKFEVNATIGNIIEIKRNLDNSEWNKLSFDDLINKSPTLINIKNRLIKSNQYNKWKKDILKRMARENLLGNRMK